MKYILVVALLLPAATYAECGKYHYSVDMIDAMREQIKWMLLPHVPQDGKVHHIQGFMPSDTEIETHLRTYMCNGTTLAELKRKDADLQKAADEWGKKYYANGGK